jgi:hypothetical protein
MNGERVLARATRRRSTEGTQTSGGFRNTRLEVSERARARARERETGGRFEAGMGKIEEMCITVSGRSQSLQTSETLNTKPTMRSSISVRYNLPDSGNSLLRLASNLVVLLAVLLVAQELRVHLRVSCANCALQVSDRVRALKRRACSRGSRRCEITCARRDNLPPWWTAYRRASAS